MHEDSARLKKQQQKKNSCQRGCGKRTLALLPVRILYSQEFSKAFFPNYGAIPRTVTRRFVVVTAATAEVIQPCTPQSYGRSLDLQTSACLL
jgi:hypothetical protein